MCRESAGGCVTAALRVGIRPRTVLLRLGYGVLAVAIEAGGATQSRLLLQRGNTGFADGSWSLPGGSLDEAGKCRVATLAILDHVCENNRAARRPGVL